MIERKGRHDEISFNIGKTQHAGWTGKLRMLDLNIGNTLLKACLVLVIVLSNYAKAQSGISVAIVSNTDNRIYQLYSKWARQQGFDAIVEPTNTLNMADQLMSLSRSKGKIGKLVFFGHGDSAGRSIAFIANAYKENVLTQTDFESLAMVRPNIPYAFAPNAQIILYACNAGQHNEFLRSVGSAFIKFYGGNVIANRYTTDFRVETTPQGDEILWTNNQDFRWLSWTAFSKEWRHTANDISRILGAASNNVGTQQSWNNQKIDARYSPHNELPVDLCAEVISGDSTECFN